MNIQVIKKEDQADGNFNNGEILEKKPIGFPQDGGKIRPYSNLFYWAHAWTPKGKSTIGLHPHQGFEICSFVLEGSINVDTINTNNTKRDNHLKTNAFFDSKKYPEITFKSTKITATKNKNKYKVTGKLTIKNITKKINFIIYLTFSMSCMHFPV